MKKNLLEYIIKTVLFEDDDSKKKKKIISVDIKELVNQDKQDYLAAGAIFGFDVKVVAKLGDGTGIDKLSAFSYIDKFVSLPEQSYFYNMLNKPNQTAIASYDFRKSERVHKFRIWIFETKFYQTIIDIPFKKYQTVGDEVLVFTKASYHISQTLINFFEEGGYWGTRLYAAIDVKIDPDGLKKYKQWYEALRKINKNKPTPNFQYIDRGDSSELGSDLGNELGEQDVSIKTWDGKFEIKSIVYSNDSGTYSETEMLISRVNVYNGNGLFTGKLQKIGDNSFELYTGILEDYKLYSSTSEFKDFEFSGYMRFGKPLANTTVKIPGKPKSITLDEFNALVQKQTSKK